MATTLPSLDDVDIELIGPAEAETYLALNTHNRNPRRKKVNQYAKDMADQNWRWTGEAISFAKDGTLLDGQNRLLAVVQSGETVPFLVVRNVEPAAQDVMDTGSARTFADALKLHGKKSAPALAAAVRLSYMWDTDRTGFRHGGGNSVPSIPALEKHLEDNPEIEDAVTISNRVSSAGLGLSIGPAIFALHTLRKIDHADADHFMSRLADGLSLEEGSPIYALRRALNRLNTDPHHGGRYYVEPLALTFKAWNLYRDGKHITRLTWRPGGSNPEQFPEPR